jgi:hypothetical protein
MKGFAFVMDYVTEFVTPLAIPSSTTGLAMYIPFVSLVHPSAPSIASISK